MIFVTVGSQLPFDRLVGAMDRWAAAHPDTEVFGQILTDGQSGFRPRHFRTVRSLAPAEFASRCAAARCIVSHAGTGVMIAAMTHRVPLVVLPRRSGTGEVRNDHQLDTVAHLGGRPGIFVAMTTADLPDALEAALAEGAPRPDMKSAADPDLIARIRAEIFRGRR